MTDADRGPRERRTRIGWWAFTGLLGLAAAFVAYSFVGILVLGVFGYYATRPIYRRLSTRIDSDGIAAWLTILVVLVPILLMLGYAGFQLFQQAQQLLGGGAGVPFLGESLQALSPEQRRTLLSTVRNPRRAITDPQRTARTILQAGVTTVTAVIGGLLLLSLSVTLSYFLLKNDDALSAGLVRLFGGRDTTAFAYASAVDEDLESVFFGNFLFVLAMTVVAAVAYFGTNLLAPRGLAVPMVLVLAFLTGVASLIPIVVGKVVYLPVVAYLAFGSLRMDGRGLVFVGGVLVAYFLVLDILPQTFLQPYITGRDLDVMVLLFAYLLGPILFGWYGFFLLPILFVLLLETVRIVLPELVSGRPLTPAVSMGESVGARPTEAEDDDPSRGRDTGGGASESGGGDADERESAGSGDEGPGTGENGGPECDESGTAEDAGDERA
ncbi:AI-2E family transporter [Halorarum halobium]|uniref:AI-2E family transporter n=1 Tax=Halorarum halobium TaxID=3075121 RepID=UPI0028A68E26|nr:AI-2E family transporter [Halobaculum sp. XH14]